MSTVTNKMNEEQFDRTMQWNMDMFENTQAFQREERNFSQQYNSNERMAAQAYNTKERLAAQQWNEQMWHMQNEYDSPSAQAERLRAAGMNPSNILNGAEGSSSIQSVGAASSTPGSSSGGGAPSAPYMTPLHYESSDLDPQAIANTLGSISDSLLKMKQARGIDIDNETRAAQNQAVIDKLLAEKKKTLGEADLNKDTRERIKREITSLEIANMRNEFAMRKDILIEQRDQATFDKNMRALDDAHDRHLADMATQKLMNQLAINRDSREGAKLQADLQKIAAEINHMKHQNGLIDAQRINESLKSKGINLDNVAKELNNAHQKMQNDSDNLDFSRKSDVQERRENAPMFRFGDDVIYWLMDQLGTPIKGAFK